MGWGGEQEKAQTSLLPLRPCTITEGNTPWLPLPPGLGIRGRRSTSATSPNVARPFVRPHCCGLMCACTQASDLSSATGSSVGRGSHAVTSCSGMPGRIQVCSPLPFPSSMDLPLSLVHILSNTPGSASASCTYCFAE